MAEPNQFSTEPFAGAPTRTNKLQDTLNERQKTHGDFSDNAVVMQQLKNILRQSVNWPWPHGRPASELTPVQCEALDMICHKIGRIITGNPNEPDHWLDIEGYARLARERL
jgi:hypothetical protein